MYTVLKRQKKTGLKITILAIKSNAEENIITTTGGKSLFLFSVGTENLEKDGIRISAAHIDSPRVDLKQHPLFEDGGMSYFKTHYYGGIKNISGLQFRLRFTVQLLNRTEVF